MKIKKKLKGSRILNKEEDKSESEFKFLAPGSPGTLVPYRRSEGGK